MPHKPHSTQSLLIDIGSASVGAAIMTEFREGPPELSHVTRVPIGTGSESGKAALLPLMGTALEALLKSYALKHPRVRVSVASPWHDATIRIVSSHTDKPGPVSEHSVTRTIEQYKNEKPPVAGRVDLEAIAVQVEVNGYPTALTKPVSGSSISINLYESEIDTEVQQKISDTIERALPESTLSLNSFPLVAAVALRSAVEEHAFVLADIGGEMTDVALIYEDGIHFLSSFPIGFQTIARSLGTKKDASGDSLSRLALYVRGELSPEEQGVVGESFKKAFTPWITECEKVLTEASDHVPIPRSVYVTSDPDPVAWIAKGITDFGTMHLVPTAVTPPLIQRFVAIGEEGSYDVFLALEAIFFHTALSTIIGEQKPV